MSAAARARLVAHPNAVWQVGARKADFTEMNTTSSVLVGLLLWLLDRGWFIEFTMIRTGHHNDGPNGHFGGKAADCWVNRSAKLGDWMNAQDLAFGKFCAEIARAPGLRQAGLAGSADTPSNFRMLGETAFHDDGGDHIHIGSE